MDAWYAGRGVVTPGPGETEWLGIRTVRLPIGEHVLDDAARGREVGVVLLSGEAELTRGAATFRLGPRRDPVEDLPFAAYFPDGDRLRVRALAPTWLMLAHAPGEPGYVPRLVTPDDVPIEERGEGSTGRTVRHVLEGEGEAARLLLVEVITPGGHWSSFPPHRHDEMRPPHRYLLEEAYLFGIRPEGHRALMGTWQEGGDVQAFAPGNGDLVMVRRGYHTVSAAPGSTLYYLNAMAGPSRIWTPIFQPGYEHLVTGWGNAPVARPIGTESSTGRQGDPSLA